MKERKEKSLENKKRLQDFCRDSGMDVTIRELPGVPWPKHWKKAGLQICYWCAPTPRSQLSKTRIPPGS